MPGRTHYYELLRYRLAGSENEKLLEPHQYPLHRPRARCETIPTDPASSRTSRLNRFIATCIRFRSVLHFRSVFNESRYTRIRYFI